MTRRKMELILDVAARHGHRVLIAGQWGCGVFLNPVPEMCELWCAAIRSRSLVVVFPVFASEFRAEMVRAQSCVGAS